MGVADFELEGKCNPDHFDSLGQGAGRHKDNSGPGALVPLQELIRKSDLGKLLALDVCGIYRWDVGNDGM